MNNKSGSRNLNLRCRWRWGLDERNEGRSSGEGLKALAPPWQVLWRELLGNKYKLERWEAGPHGDYVGEEV